MIILEGPNGCGKSVLARDLARALNRPIFKFPTPIYHFEVYANAARVLPRSCILDRHPMISDQVYSQIMFGEKPIPFLPSALCAHRIIYVRIPIENAKRNHTYTKNDPFRGREMEIFAAYESIMSFLPHIRFDWIAGDTVDKLLDKLYIRKVVG